MLYLRLINYSVHPVSIFHTIIVVIKTLRRVTIVKIFLFAIWSGVVVLAGCYSPPIRVSSYQDLTQHGKIEDVLGGYELPSDLRGEKVFLVTGANYEIYISNWDKEDQKIQTGAMAGLLNFRKELAVMHESTSPESITGLVVLSLHRFFGKIEPVRDFSEARARHARWMILIDFSRVGDGYMTTLDLLDGNMRRLVHVENKVDAESVPFSLSDDDIMRNVARVNAKAIHDSVTKTTEVFEKTLRGKMGKAR